jgi:hypothetical protein
VECRERTCRVEADLASREDAQFLMVNLLDSMKGSVGSGRIFSEKNANGTINAQLYLQRKTSP